MTMRLMFVVSSCAAMYRPAHSIFGSKNANVNSPHKSTNFLSDCISNNACLSRLRDVDFRSLPSNMKPHISNVAIGVTFTSWAVNTLRATSNPNKSSHQDFNETTRSEAEEPIASEACGAQNTPPSPSPPSSPYPKTKDATVTDYKFNIDPAMTTSVFVQFQSHEIDNTLEHGVCNSTYVSQDSDEISIEVGDIVTIHSKTGLFWWHGVNSKGERGMFPAANVVSIKKQQQWQITANK